MSGPAVASLTDRLRPSSSATVDAVDNVDLPDREDEDDMDDIRQEEMDDKAKKGGSKSPDYNGDEDAAFTSAMAEATAGRNWRGYRGGGGASDEKVGKGMIFLESTVMGTPTQRMHEVASATSTRGMVPYRNGGDAEGVGGQEAEENGDDVVWVTETATAVPVSTSTTSASEDGSSLASTIQSTSAASESASSTEQSTTTSAVETSPIVAVSSSSAGEQEASDPVASSASTEIVASTESISASSAMSFSVQPSATDTIQSAQSDPSSAPTSSPAPSASPSPPPSSLPSPPPSTSSTWSESSAAPSSVFSPQTWTSSIQSSASPTSAMVATGALEQAPSSESVAASTQDYTSLAHQNPDVTSSWSENMPINSGTAQGANKEADRSTGPSKGTTAGAVIGGLLAFFIIATLLLCCLKARRKKGDKAKMMRSSWFYGGDVSLPEDESGAREKSYLQSRFSAPSMSDMFWNRFSSVVANLNPLNLARPSSSRYPDVATPGFVTQPLHAPPTPPPVTSIPSQGGWADRFFAGAPGSIPHDGAGTPLPLGMNAYPSPMVHSQAGGSPLHVVNRSSGGPGSTRQLTPFIRVESPSDRSSTSSISSTSCDQADLGKVVAKRAVLNTLAQRSPSSTLEYGSSYADLSRNTPTVPAPFAGRGTTPHQSSLFEYDRPDQRRSVADTGSVYSINTAYNAI